jgi:porin
MALADLSVRMQRWKRAIASLALAIASAVLSPTAWSQPAPTPTPTPPPAETREQGEPAAASSPGQVLLTDSLGRVVVKPASSVPRSLLPPAHIGLDRQVPQLAKGARAPAEVELRNEAARPAGFQLFPGTQPRLMSYLAAQDELGNTAIAPGPLVDVFPAEPLVQGAKYRLGQHGLRYQLDQTFIGTGADDATAGSSNMGYYTFKLFSKWAVFEDPVPGSAGWISAQVNAKEGLDAAGQTQTAKATLGTLTDPTPVADKNGFRVPELAWQQSLRRGEFVLLAGVINQGNYLDASTYANSGRGQFLNSALINSMVVPTPAYNFSVNLQWQPTPNWYAMLGATAGNASAGETPWTNFSWADWSIVSEFGFSPDDFLGLGPGVYRIQPFLARAGGPVQGGVGFNFQQQLGEHSPFGWFGRFGVGGSQVSAGASTQIGTGFVLQAPLEHIGLAPRLTNDLLGMGFVWSQPSATTKTVYHRNEYVWETFYTLQLSPTARLEPDLQLIWDPVFSPDSGPATVFQVQMILAW